MDHRFSKADRDYIIGLKDESLQGIRISKEFLDLIGAPEELKAKFEMFKSKYKKYPQFGYNSVLRDRSVSTHIYFQKTINRINVENFFTEEDIETLIDCWVNTYTEAYDWLTARGVVDKTVENVCDFVSEHYLGIGCAVFGVAALAGIIPAIAKKYKSEADIRDAVNYYMGSVDWDKNDESKSVPRSFVAWDAKGNPTVRVYHSTLEGNKDTAEEIFRAVAKAAKKNGTTVRQEFHNLDGKKVKGLGGKETDEDAFRFDILKDKDGVLTIEVWGQAGKKPKTFKIDTNTYQRIGDVQYSWNESRKRSGRVKESRVVCDNNNAYQFQQKLLGFFDDYLAMPIVKAEVIKGNKPKPFTYLEHDEYGTYVYEVCLFGEYEDDVIIELYSALIGGGCAYRLLTGDGSNCEHWMGMSLDEFEKDLDECFKVALSYRNKKVTESKKLKEFRPSKFRYDLDKSVSTKDKWNLKMDIESLKKELGDLQNTAAHLPDAYVDDLCDSNNYPFDANIDDETSLGDWCQEVDDFLSNSLSLKENRKPYTPCEISAWEAKNYIQRQNLTCENEQGTLRIFYGPLEVGCMVFTPASYYLAGLDETVYWEGTTMDQFRVDFEEFKATLREADVEFTETGWINPYKG